MTPTVPQEQRGGVTTITAPGPAQLVLMAAVARRYYLDNRSKVEIAEEFALSRLGSGERYLAHGFDHLHQAHLNQDPEGQR